MYIYVDIIDFEAICHTAAKGPTFHLSNCFVVGAVPVSRLGTADYK